MIKDYTLSRREEREHQQREQAIYQTLNRASVGLASVLFGYLMWAFHNDRSNSETSSMTGDERWSTTCRSGVLTL